MGAGRGEGPFTRWTLTVPPGDDLGNHQREHIDRRRTIKTYLNHPCQRSHRTAVGFIRCRFPRNGGVRGAGQYCVIIRDRSWRFQLFETEEQAQRFASGQPPDQDTEVVKIDG